MSRRSLKDVVRDWKATLKESDGIKISFKRNLKGKRRNGFAAVVDDVAKGSGEVNSTWYADSSGGNNRFEHQLSYLTYQLNLSRNFTTK